MKALWTAARTLARNPSFSAIVVLTLALGIGAGTIIFSVIDGVLVRPLPYREPEGIVRVFQINDEGFDRVNPSDPNFADLKEQTHSFAAFAQFTTLPQPVLGGSGAARLEVAHVSREFHDVIGVQPALGRTFLADEQQPGGPRAALISHGYWQRYLGGTPDFASRSLRVGGVVFSIVGVMPAGFDYPDRADLWVPRELEPPNPYRKTHNYRAVGRLAPGASLEQAQADARSVALRLKQQYGDDTWMADVAIVRLQDFVTGSVQVALLVLGAAVALLFVVACTNVVSMLLARAIARRQETAVRVALGAGRWRLAREFFVEMVLLCGAGAAAGMALAWWGLELIGSLHAGALPRAEAIRIDWLSVVFATTLAFVTAVALSLLLARNATRAGITLAADRRAGGGRRSRARDALIAVQTALAVVLVIGALLLGRSFMRLVTVEPGFTSDDVLLMNLALPMPAQGEDTTAQALFYEQLIDRARALPNVAAVGGITAPPLTGGAGNGLFLELRRPDEVKTFDDFEKLARKDAARTGFAEFRIASDDYFAAVGIPLLRGRTFERGDGPGSEHVAVISRSFAESKWPGEDPLGKLVQFGNMDSDLTPFRIVGIVGDVREYGLDAEQRPTFYGTYRQRTRSIWWSFWIAIRAPNAEGLVPAAREIVRSLNPDLVPEFRTVAQLVSTSVAPRRFNLVMLGILGATALLLALAGIYGAVAFNVAQRTHEIGVRVALGARARSVVAMALRQSLWWVAIGVVAGFLIALGASRVVGSLLYGVSPHDPIAYASAATILLAAAVAAAWLPARRAARVDPMVALRQE